MPYPCWRGAPWFFRSGAALHRVASRAHRKIPDPGVQSNKPANEAETHRTHRRRQPPVSSAIRHPDPMSRTRDMAQALPRVILEHRIHGASLYTRTHGRCAVSGRGAHGCPTDAPKIPNLQIEAEIAANEIMRQGLASSPESPYGAVTCEEDSASTPSAIYRLKSVPIWHTVAPDLTRGPSLTVCARRSRSRKDWTAWAGRERPGWAPDQVRGDGMGADSARKTRQIHFLHTLLRGGDDTRTQSSYDTSGLNFGLISR